MVDEHELELSEDKLAYLCRCMAEDTAPIINKLRSPYTKLISALARTACEQKRISPVERPQENLKYAMRLFLVRLGFVGDEFKQARKILLRDLSGNCSWKAGHAPKRRNVADDSERRNEP